MVVIPCLTNKLCILIVVAGMWSKSLLRGLGGKTGVDGSLGSHYRDQWQHGTFINVLLLCSGMEFSVRRILGLFSCLHFKMYPRLCEMGIAVALTLLHSSSSRATTKQSDKRVPCDIICWQIRENLGYPGRQTKFSPFQGYENGIVIFISWF